MGRADQCEYDDKKQKSRTQKLREKLQFLENRLRELETEQSSPGQSISSSAPHTQAYPTPCSEPLGFDLVYIADLSNVDQYGDLPASGLELSEASMNNVQVDLCLSMDGTSRDATFFGSHGIEQSAPTICNDTHHQGYFSTNAESPPSNALMAFFDDLVPEIPAPTTTTDEIPTITSIENLPFEVKNTIIGAFLAHRHQCWFDGDVSKLIPNPFDQSPQDDYHPALMNAIYLLGCHFTRSPCFTAWEDEFFKRTISEINTALTTSDRLIDIVRASSLLSSYLYTKGRNLEAYAHAFAACRLAVGLGLHRLRPSDDTSSPGHPSGNTTNNAAHAQPPDEPPSIPIKPPQDQAEWRERVCAFWQAFSLDRCWSTALGLPVALPHGATPRDKVITPWLPPLNTEEGYSYETLAPAQNYTNPYSLSVPSLRAKAAALYEKATRLSSSRRKDEKFLNDHQVLSTAFQRFSAGLPPFVGLEPWRTQPPLVDVELLFIHTLAYITSIHITESSPAQANLTTGKEEIILNIVNATVRLTEELSDVDYEFLDPFLSACWYHLAKILLRCIKTSVNIVFASDPTGTKEEYILGSKLTALIYALKKLSLSFPVAGDYLRKIEPQWQALGLGLASY